MARGLARSGKTSRKKRERRGPEARRSEAEETLHALRAGLIDALVIDQGQQASVYALKTFEEVEAANSQLQQSQQKLLLALNDRERLMQDLHDGCIQSIYAVGLALEHCRTVMVEEPQKAEQCVAQAVASLNLVIQELRGFISGAEVHVDFARDIARIVDAAGAHGPTFRVDINRAVAQTLSQHRAGQLLQIAREALSNIVRHAGARTARIALRRRANRICLEVSDDGKGFDVRASNGSGLGLHHISARVQKLGGRLRLTSRPLHGCRIVVELQA